jgi:hypothetical protein
MREAIRRDESGGAAHTAGRGRQGRAGAGTGQVRSACLCGVCVCV